MTDMGTCWLHFNADSNPPLMTQWFSPSANLSFAQFEAAREIVEASSFQAPNWDGFEAIPISTAARNHALRALSHLEASAPGPAVIPNPNGTFAFEWETDEGIGHLEVGRTQYSFYLRPTTGPAVLLDGSAEQLLNVGWIVNERLYPKQSEPAYLNMQIATNE